MAKTDPEPRELLTDTMKKLFPPRVELDRGQHERLQKLCEKTGKALGELVAEAVERYLEDEGQNDARAGALP
jgi:hypothetical protein